MHPQNSPHQPVSTDHLTSPPPRTGSTFGPLPVPPGRHPTPYVSPSWPTRRFVSRCCQPVRPDSSVCVCVYVCVCVCVLGRFGRSLQTASSTSGPASSRPADRLIG
ncbi:unnamed protein product [Protopolystoma xenopodis]|uniref:Uncharacterized protein n=1 Tax=Protopolystoma xenopodis TaxID=117903 RepID=A0A3S5B2R9_9PLAT|nr:unnamed protein product [Protopolystoma xenopodis]